MRFELARARSELEALKARMPILKSRASTRMSSHANALERNASTNASNARSGRRASRAHSTSRSRRARVVATRARDEANRARSDDITLDRRQCALTIASTLTSLTLATSSDANARTTIAYEGSTREAYAFDVPLKALASRGSVTSASEREFASAQGKRIKFTLKTSMSIAEVVNAMAKKERKMMDVDCATIGDEWLAYCVANGLILPFADCERSAWFRGLPPIWRALVRRDSRTGNVSASGNVYGAPYRFGCATLAYRTDKLPKGVAPPRDWVDLFDPRLKGLIGMPNAPRMVLSAALKAEGMSVNAADVGGVDGRVRRRVETLRANVKVFDDLQYLQAFACGDVAVVVGPSEDVLSVARRSSFIRVVVPASGTTLWSDVWVVPSATLQNKSGGPSPAVEQWIEYSLQPARVNMRVGLKGGISPLMFDGSGIEGGYARYPSVTRPVLGNKDEDMLKGWLPPDSVWAASEFQLPLSDRARAQYVAMSRAIVGAN